LFAKIEINLYTYLMLGNYHTHTYLCQHATGTVADYAAQAAKDECTALGFSDHCPYPADGIDTWPRIRMAKEDTPHYMKAVRQAASTAPFPVYCGFECEWAPRYEAWYRDFLLGEMGADYLVFGAHWLIQRRTITYAADLSGKKEIRAYFDQTIEGMHSGLYRFLAHPDLMMADGREWNRELASLFGHLIDAAMECGLPLEINGYGFIKPQVRCPKGNRYPYPVEEFWKLALEKGAPIICNSDAHSPDYVIAGVQNACNFGKKMGITPLKTLDLHFSSDHAILC
jgi:histidinol-phosphatase (PHP family)